MLRAPDAFLKEGSKVFRLAPVDKRLIRSLIDAAQAKTRDVEVEAVSLDTRQTGLDRKCFPTKIAKKDNPSQPVRPLPTLYARVFAKYFSF